uniref:Uncharacterized protein n=1 Tax=Cannabis sativa TaxID=3483 RepID=A0A803NSR7_CANSA
MFRAAIEKEKCLSFLEYFPSTDFLSADLGNNPSFVWRSIWDAQRLVRLGAVRTIGNGESTSILSHPWLPDPKNQYVTSIHSGLLNNSVSSLIDVHSCYWDRDVIQDLFHTRDAKLILGSYSYEVVARDSSGRLIEAKTGYQTGAYSAETIEAMGIKEALI